MLKPLLGMTLLKIASLPFDDFKMSYGACPNPGSCTFENKLDCMYDQRLDQTLYWQKTSGSRPITDMDKGVIDHTTGTVDGYYLAVSTDMLVLLDETSAVAKLQSNHFRGNST